MELMMKSGNKLYSFTAPRAERIPQVSAMMTSSHRRNAVVEGKELLEMRGTPTNDSPVDESKNCDIATNWKRR
eukprot:15430753-Alexandrium_andersonii.AAC.1